MYRFVIFILVLVFIEVYSYRGLRELETNLSPLWRKVFASAYWSTAIIGYGLLIYLMINRPNMHHYRSYYLFNFAAGFMLICLAGKLLFGSFHLINDLVNLAKWLWIPMTEKPSSEPHEKMTRIHLIKQVGFAASAA